MQDENNNTYATNNLTKAELLVSHFSRISSNDNFSPEFINHKKKFEKMQDALINGETNDNDPINEPFTFAELKKATESKKRYCPWGR